MGKDLTTSFNDRKNILSNSLAIRSCYLEIGFRGILFENKYRFTKQQISSFFEVDLRTIDRILENHRQELDESGYELFIADKLKRFKEFVSQLNDINVVQLGAEDHDLIGLRATSLGVFTFKSFLNVGMLLQGSDKARELRSAILNIVIDVLNKKLGGNTKYINQREEEFLTSAIREYNYRKEFTDALDNYLEPNKFKYGQLTDKIYISIFKENAKEYRQILNLNSKESVRATMYSEVLDLIASYENGFASFLKKKFEEKKTKFRLSECHLLFKEFEDMSESIYEPLREKARSLMASRDMAFRDALHEKLKNYINEVSLDDIDKFLGEKSRLLEERIEENKEVFKRLKDR